VQDTVGARNAETETDTKTRVFISYSRKDMAFVDRVEAALNGRGFEVLIDREEIYAFEDWWKRIEALIGRADTVVFALSPDAVKSDVALKEVTHAASLNKRFAPIVARRVEDSAVPEALARLNFIFFDDEARFAESIERLAAALATDIEWIRKHTEYGEDARHWAAANRPSGLLLRSPALEEAERWIASRPANAPAPTAETQAFIAESRRWATRRRNILTASLAAGLVLALALAGLAFWQRSVAVAERQIAEAQRKRAEDTLAAATKTANSLIVDLARHFRDTVGIPASLVKDILDRARALQEQLVKSGEVTPDLKRSEAVALNETARTLLAIGDTRGALAAAEEARQIASGLAEDSPDGKNERNLEASYVRLGDVQMARGDLAAALNSYQQSLAIADRLAKSDPGNARGQRDLYVSYEKVGDAQAAQNDFAAALNSYLQGLAVAEALAKSAPSDANRQRDLEVAYMELGDVQVEQGELAGALKSYQADLVIAERLAQTDSGNAARQRDLSVSHEKVGDVRMAQGDLVGALKSYQADLAVAERLAQSDPGNAGWQRDLSVSYEKVGDVQAAQGDLAGALKSYQADLAVAKRLAQSDPGNAGWQRDLALTYASLANLYRQSNDPADALAALRQGEAIADRLTKLAPDNAQWQSDLVWFKDQIADFGQ
jgi:tetratricopeptide (TPR) repeat protein